MVGVIRERRPTVRQRRNSLRVLKALEQNSHSAIRKPPKVNASIRTLMGRLTLLIFLRMCLTVLGIRKLH